MKKKGQQKKKRRRLRVKVVITFLLFVIIVAALASYITNLKIKNIYIKGTTSTKDVEIIEIAGIKDYPNIYKLKLKDLETKINTLPLIKEAKVSRTPLGKLNIDVVETKILLFYKYNNKYITSSNDSIDPKENYYGYPTLINFTPDTIFDKLIEGLNKVDYNIIKMINEIEYTPYKNKQGQIIDENLFTLKMNDGNTVKIDTVNITNLNKYTTIYVSLEMDKTKGVVYLDTIMDESLLFISYETLEKERLEKEQEHEENKNKDKDKDKTED